MAQVNGVNGEGGKTDYDAIVIGAGFGGLRIIPELNKLGLSYTVIEAGTGVGGTWYWNRYPGARTDSESWVYILNFSKEIQLEWKWQERFPRQPEVLRYLNFVADKLDCRKDIQFSTRVKAAHFDDSKNIWTLTTDKGKDLTCKYFISASGVLSVGRELPFPGVEKFKGEYYKTYDWPKHEVEYTGKRVAVIGTGATAVQVIPIVAHTAKSVTVFQRTPNFVLPARNHPVTEDHWKYILTNYDDIWANARKETFGMSFDDSQLKMMEMKDEKQINRVLERGWESGGFRYIFETFVDLLTSTKANAIASEFVKDKIRAIVHDEKTAELLCPDHALMAKRPPLGHYYYEVFNKPSVSLIDVKNNPITEITETGLKTGTDEYEFDMIIYAIGFDAVTGPYTQMDIRGRGGKSLKEQWDHQLETFLGIMVENFPNMWMISAPQSPFANLPIVLDNTAGWIGLCLKYMQEHHIKAIEPKNEAMEEYCKALADGFNATILPNEAKKAGSWYVGQNVPGKKFSHLFWFSGVVSYFEICNREIDSGFKSLNMT